MGPSIGALAILAISCLRMGSFHHLIQAEPVQQSDDLVSIKRQLTLKDETKYKMEGALSQVITLPTGLTQSMTTAVSADLSFKGGDDLEDGKLPFTLEVAHLKLDSTPPQPGDSKDRTVTLKGLVDEQNQMSVISIKGIRRDDQAIAGLVARMAQGVGTYPDKPVKIGDSWTVSEEESFLGNKKLEYPLHYDAKQTVGNLTLYVVSTKTDVPVTVDLGAMDNGGQPGSNSGMAMQGTVHITAQAFIDQNGLINSLMFETKAEVTVDSPDANGQIKLVSDEIVKIARTP